MNLGTRYELADRALALAAGCDCCADETVRDESWRRTACAARRLSWVSLAWMCTEGAVAVREGTRSWHGDGCC